METGVLILCAGSGIGGMERLVETLARELPRQGMAARVILPEIPDSEPTLRLLLAAGISAERSSALKHAFERRGPDARPALAAFLRAQPERIVNAHYCLTHVPLDDALAASDAGKSYWASLHSADFGKEPSDDERRQAQEALNLCRGAILVSNAQRQGLVRAGMPPDRLHVIPCGVPSPRRCPSQADARAELGLPADAFVIATASRMTWRKGVMTLIQAAAQMPESGPPVWLAAAGAGSELPLFQQLAAAQMGERACFYGHLDDLSPLYAACDVFALASTSESFGMVYAEAAFFAKPSVAAAVGGTPEATLHGRTGLLCAPGDADAFAASLQALRQDPLARALMGQSARTRALDMFTASKMAEAYAGLLGRGEED